MDEPAGGPWERFALWEDVRRGEAGLPTRAALSLTAALVLLAAALLVLGLPMFPDMTEAQVTRVAETI